MATSPQKQRLQDFLDEVWSGGDVGACDRHVGETYTIRHDLGDPCDG